MIEVDAAVAAGQFESALDGFRKAGFAVRMVMPADDPAIALLEGSEMTIRLVSGEAEWPGSDVAMPPLAPAFELSRLADTGWGVGRAGMLYRDLLPSRQGGRFIASHIRIPDAGPVPDEVHFHNIRFQLIFCVAGWVRLVYEDQGHDFVVNAGDCVLQPPTIRHRVLESSGVADAAARPPVRRPAVRTPPRRRGDVDAMARRRVRVSGHPDRSGDLWRRRSTGGASEGGHGVEARRTRRRVAVLVRALR